jgi:periplasmic protein TonB
MFQQTFVEQGNKTRKGASVLVSFAMQVMVVIVFVLIPLIYTDILPKAAINAFLVAPPPPLPPPPPPPPVAPKIVKVVHHVFDLGHLLAPTKIPDNVAILVDDATTPSIATSNVIGSLPGPPGGPTGVINGIITSPPTAPPQPPAVKELKPAPVQRVKVGGQVQQAMLIRQVKPNYPSLARQARISGTVRFTAIIGKDGTIQNLQLVSGHPLLVPAASDAVKQWLYKPTYLNTEPVEVITQIEVNFTLGQ